MRKPTTIQRESKRFHFLVKMEVKSAKEVFVWVCVYMGVGDVQNRTHDPQEPICLDLLSIPTREGLSLRGLSICLWAACMSSWGSQHLNGELKCSEGKSKQTQGQEDRDSVREAERDERSNETGRATSIDSERQCSLNNICGCGHDNKTADCWSKVSVWCGKCKCLKTWKTYIGRY